MSSIQPHSQRLPPWLQGLLAGLTLWGLYLAIGATGLFSRGRIATDPRRSLIVFACSAIFLGSWYYILKRRRATAGVDRETLAQAESQSWNHASLASAATAVIGYLLWGTAWLMWAQPASKYLTAPLGYLSALAFGAATIMALVGLSHPRRRKGQLVGVLTIMLLAAAVVAFVIQVQNFSARRGARGPLPPQPPSALCATSVLSAFSVVKIT